MRIQMKCSKKPLKLVRRIDFARVDFNRNEKLIQLIFIDQFKHLVSNYRQLESEVANQLCSLEEKDLTISTQLSTISTQTTTLLDNELAKQILEFTISNREQSISELRLTNIQLEENARFNLAQFLPDGHHGEPLHLPCQDSLQLGTLPESTHLGGLKISLSASSSNSILTQCVLSGLVLDDDAQGDLLRMGEADDQLHEGDVLLFVSTGGSRSGVSLPHSTPTSSTPPVTLQQILPKTEKIEMEPSKFAYVRDIDKDSKVKVFDDLSTKYSNPNLFKKSKPGKRPRIVPKVFQAIWKFLLAPHLTISDPTPDVDWSQVRFKPPLPDPEQQGVHSACQDPEFYARSNDYLGNDAGSTFTACSKPFGTIFGYRTTMGFVPVPNHPVGGYIYCLETNRWLLHATSGPSTRVSWGTARRGTPGGTGGRGRR